MGISIVTVASSYVTTALFHSGLMVRVPASEMT